MMIAPVLPNALSITRARLRQRGEGQDGRRLLESSLSGVTVFDITGPDEVLVVPHMLANAHISPRMPYSHFAEQIAGQLRQIRREALVDPSGEIPQGQAIRFTSHHRYAAWLILSWLKPTSFQARETLVDLLKGQSLEQWQRRAVLGDGQRIVNLVRALLFDNAVVEWATRLSSGECVLAIRALGQAFGFQPDFRATASPDSIGTSGIIEESKVLHAPRRQARRAMIGEGHTHSVRAIMRHVTQTTEIHNNMEFRALPTETQALIWTALMLAEKPSTGSLLDGRLWLSLPSLAMPTQAEREGVAKPVHDPFPQQKRRRSTWQSPDTQGQTVSRFAIGQPVDRPERIDGEPFSQQQPLLESPAARSSSDAEPQPANVNIVEPGPRIQRSGSFYTEFGGLMFMANILLALKLYPDFTSPLGKRLEPSPFWLIARLGVCFFGKSFQRDPLCGFLSECGHHGALPKDWQIDREWLAGLGGRGTLRRYFDGKNLMFRDSRGFAISDHVQKPWSRKTFAFYRKQSARDGRTRPQADNARWIAHLADFLRFRIRITAPDMDISKLRLPAKVEVFDDTIKLHFSLADLPLAVRLAGLDRDPGWLPSEGRSIAFHFS